MKAMFLLLGLVTACGTTIHASDYATDCDADMGCSLARVGDICSCTCEFAAISSREYDRYLSDVQRIGACRDNCVSSDPDAAPFTCGGDLGAQCTGGVCTTYTLPSDAGAE
jgi:hypothetical protein